MTDRARPGFVAFLRHPARKWSGSILTTLEPTWGFLWHEPNVYSQRPYQEEMCSIHPSPWHTGTQGKF